MSRRRRDVRALTAFTALALTLCACGGSGDEDEAAPVPAASPPGSSEPTSEQSTPAAAPSATAPGPDARATVTNTLATGLDTPWGIAFLPDGSALVSLRDSGEVVRVPAQGGDVEQVGEVPGVSSGGTAEGGLLGIALHPDYPSQPWLYAYYTTGDENVLSRMRYTDGALGRPQELLDGVDAAAYHNGGRIGFGPDGMLYVATGDGTDRDSAQDPDDTNGKILRLTPEGEPAPDNPTRGSAVYSSGHRNIEGIAWDEAGQLWASEFGDQTWDELNRIEPGANYGWPQQEGEGGGSGLVDPFVQWSTDEASPAGVAITGGAAYVASLRGERLWQVPLDGGEPRALFTGDHGRLRTVVLAPDGSLWLTTSNNDGRGNPGVDDDRILRVTLS
ncbi:PQQ-dependent sugar dehydrogenase [Motilibacter aurantiacus]|uniref:PQQ-dependent sugar dehydrogenase n=1 Tax=Motilibacter aurantiacus TaxID=2714955 RepID=UPI00140744FD|nr:PQQ-dependent sugar dehydrogenase [Motilibacter aurantiacus]NHC44696.1 PQQ-dependent sugar dehydrogenase [Motilibacter aurantiacus]